METITFLNALDAADGGWAHLAPIGHYPGPALRRRADGTLERITAVQCIDEQSMTQIANAFAAPVGTQKRWRASVPIYRGHPDFPGMEARYPDKTPLGDVLELDRKESGLWIRPCFGPAAVRAIESGEVRALSARWEAEPAGEKDGQPMFRPIKLLSVGLTPTPNLPVEFMNEWLAGTTADSTGPTPPTMNREQLIALLQKHKIEFANDATDDQLVTLLDTRVVTLANEMATATTETDRLKAELKSQDVGLARQADELKTAKADFANERKARIEAELDLATAQGRITAAQRNDWEGKLTADFANEQPAMRKLAPTVKTQSVTGDIAARDKAQVANSAEELTGTARIAASIEKQLNPA